METTSFFTKKAIKRTFGEVNDFIEAVIMQYFHEHRTLKKIQIAGTNGKGSTSAMIYSILREAGYLVGFFTSPSLVFVNERIELNGKTISDERLVGYIPAIRSIEAKMGRRFSGFDRITAAGALYFIEEKVDYAVMETGLGGRFDTVTAVPDIVLAVITTIAMDHEVMLGRTLTDMAFEKCGILNYKTPLVTAPQEPEAAIQMEATVHALKNNILRVADCEITNASSKQQNCAIVDTGSLGRFELTIPLYGAHQRINAALALLAALQLREIGAKISNDQILNGIKNTIWRGRMQILNVNSLNCSLLLDGAHNPNAMHALSDAIREAYGENKRFTAIVSIMQDKNIDGILMYMSGFVEKAYCVAVNERAIAANDLAQKMFEHGITALSCPSLDDALSKLNDENNDIVLICGSLYLVGAVLAKFE
ncbi:MAG: Mur ligase family protein [Clostridia bacterium]